MNWDAIGAVGEILGALAVVATLGYLAVQIRQGNQNTENASRQTILENFYRNLWDMARDPEVRRVALAALNRYSELSPEEKSGFELLELCFMANLYNALHLRQAGLIDDESFELIANQFISTILTPGGRDWWAIASSGPEVPPTLKAFVEKRLSEKGLPKSWTEVHADWKEV